MTSIHTEVASSSSEEATRGALDSALHPPDDERERTDGYAEQSGPRGDNRVGDMIIVSASCDVKESLDPAATDHSCARLRVPSPCTSFPAAPEPPYPPFPRYSSTTDTASPGNPPRMGSLVFKRLRREMDSPSPRHYKMMMCVTQSIVICADAAQSVHAVRHVLVGMERRVDGPTAADPAKVLPRGCSSLARGGTGSRTA